MSFPCYVGCACDRAFVDLTCTMLSSVEESGGLPDAVVVVADFGLSALDRDLLRGSAGALGARMRFVPLSEASPHFPVLPQFRFPLPLLGRFVIPKTITEPDARLVVIDADMIVNSSLRPLVDMDMQGHPIGAIRDPLCEPELIARGRALDPSYFNAGLLLIDVDRWNRQDLSNAAMRRLAAYPHPPIWLDQDALNEVVGDDWLRLDRSWNLFYAGDPRQFTLEEYRAAPIAHFAGAKPKEAWAHPAISLYHHHVERVVEQIVRHKADREVRVDWDYIATSYEIFLGRELDDARVVADREHWSALAVLKSIVGSPEFTTTILEQIADGSPFAPYLFQGCPSLRQRRWAADRLPILDHSVPVVMAAQSWRELLAGLVADERLMEWCGLAPVTANRQESQAA